MKNIWFALVSALAIILSPTFTNAQAVDQGNIVIDVTYGFPNLYTEVLKRLYVNSGSEENVEIKGIGPVGIRGEYFATERLAIGLEVNYSNTKITWEEDGINSMNENVTYKSKLTVPRLRIMPKISFHYGNADAFDFYSAIAAGYNSTQFNFETSDNNEDFEADNLLPVAFRLSTGAKYFFNENIGLHMEIGLGGGGLLAGGLSIKL